MLSNLVLLALAVGSTFAAQCGSPAIAPNLSASSRLINSVTGKSDPRIVGGIEATPHSWPWQVALHYNGDQQCGGSILNNQWVLSAAHCCYVAPSEMHLAVGTHDHTRLAPGGKNIKVSKYINHPGYSSGPTNNDFCLLKLAEPLEFNDHVSPVCLPTSADGPVGQVCHVTGWGWTEPRRRALSPVNRAAEPRNYPDRLRQVNVAISDQDKCNKAYGNVISPQMICAAAPGKDSCNADSGGPLVCQNAEGLFKLVGVVSWGRGCAQEGYPGIYARTITAVDWIEQTISNN